MYNSIQDIDNSTTELKKRVSYWSTLIKLKKEFTDETKSINDYQYIEWITETYGFVPFLTQDGWMTEDYVVVDEQKFLVYILKYGK